ncbi:hypothetical protein SCP_0701010 [Sparassis crispa]|uniref:Tautomerase cis-CaaD-like domain-containing protein n=1 Tax=Sparassis crispa TaxID=139825 RepID=A0A401GRY8_9APHY|nr:hypothetical protein SCP_0701010 [Sparassis crispa]GBE84920.1 hypothetical protein SCP_0701010 [Sparassis crispa]
MPVYYIYHDESAFTSAQKQSIANGIADAHVAATDAPRFFVKVAFVGRAHGDLFSNGAAAPDMVQVVGNIRAGRDSAHRYKLLTLLDDVIVRNAGGKKFLVEVTLMERPAENVLLEGMREPEVGSAEEDRCRDLGHVPEDMKYTNLRR